ncbi:protein N-terminal glutamine amidohydrolase-like [Rhodamnia argentea]|uniref:Protein N-terminal glutamine amidohydrolase-like n=1 Tax=Rhodamnia argentea TaxID=178133 RepID=A0A8B8Q6V0_9MYRT|nr:protein N-terminal glutamine amidohydrolase-like [Rhodamnia argentea]
MTTRERDRDRELLIPVSALPENGGSKSLSPSSSPPLLWHPRIITPVEREKATPLLWCGIRTLPSSFLLPWLSMFQKLHDPGFSCSPSIRGMAPMTKLENTSICLSGVNEIKSRSRRHMKEPDGTRQAQPPANDPIVAEDGTVHNLNENIEIRAADAVENVDNEVINTI